MVCPERGPGLILTHSTPCLVSIPFSSTICRAIMCSVQRDLARKGDTFVTVTVYCRMRRSWQSIPCGNPSHPLCAHPLTFPASSHPCLPTGTQCANIFCYNGGEHFYDGTNCQCRCAPGYTGPRCEAPRRTCQPLSLGQHKSCNYPILPKEKNASQNLLPLLLPHHPTSV